MNSAWDDWMEDERSDTPVVDNHGRLLPMGFLISAAQARGWNMATGSVEIMSHFTGRIEKCF